MLSKEESFIVRITFPTGEVRDEQILRDYPDNDTLDRVVLCCLKYRRFKECSVDIVKKTHYIIKEETK